MVRLEPVLMSQIMAHTLHKRSIQISLLLFFAEGLRRSQGPKISPDFFHFCQHNFMEREYQWDRFGRLIKSRSAGSFFPPLSFCFLLSSSSFFKHSLGPGFSFAACFPSLSFLPSPPCPVFPHAPVHPLSAQQSGATS